MTIGESFLDIGFAPAPTPEKVAELALCLLSELGQLEQADVPRLMASARYTVGAIETVLSWRERAAATSESSLTEVLW
jgi:hypothetical protein